MMGSRNQKLVERIESLEEEVRKQRLLLRHALERSEPVAEVPTAEDTAGGAAREVAGTRKTGAGRTGKDEKMSGESSWSTKAHEPIGSFPGKEDSGETAAAKSGSGSFAALTELFRLRGWEWWLNKTGIGLLLFGVVFLFKFSVDQGWLTPEVRVGCGLALGAGLVWLGLRVYEERRAFSQVVLGGGVGTFYITAFAAFQLYELVPYALAFAFLIVVTLLAFALSIRQNEAVLALIGAVGGFGTPFLLYSDAGSLGGFVLYTTLILVGIAAIYLYKGWRSLLLVSAGGVFGALFAGYSQATGPVIEAGRTALQAGVLFAVLVLWLVPVAREVLRCRRPVHWPSPEPGNLARSFFSGAERALHPSLPAHLLSGVVPIAGLAFTQEIWGLPKEPLGWMALGAALAYALTAVTLRRVEGRGRLHYTNALMALLLFTFGILLILQGNALFFALAAEAAVLHFVARRFPDKAVSALAHGLFFTVGLWLSGRIIVGVEETFYFGAGNPAFLSVGALLDLFVVALALVASTLVTSRGVARVYRVAAHVALLGLIFRELIGLPGGDTLAFLSWAAYATALHLLSRHHSQWGTVAGAHVIWGILGLWLAGRLAWGLLGWERMAVFNLPAISDLAVICLALLASFLLSRGSGAVVYHLVVHAAMLAWFWRALGAFPEGAAYVTISWSVYAAGLLVIGLRRSSTGLVRLGVFTLFLVVGKLFLVDLVWVSTIWRILLFLGAGGLFLILSYYLQALWKTGSGFSREHS